MSDRLTIDRACHPRDRASWRCALLGAALCVSLPVPATAAGRVGVKLAGRWLESDHGAIATYAGSEVLLSFTASSSVTADFFVSGTQHNTQDLYVAVSVDGGKRVRLALSPGPHPRVSLAAGLSAGPHTVSIRKEGEPYFGALRFANPMLTAGGTWRDIVDDRPIVEVLGDSDATGICALGPDSPATAAPLFTAAWASESASWVGLLAAGLAGVGHSVEMVDLALSGSDAKEEAAAYDFTAFWYSDARFAEYAPPGRKHASLVLLWGGGNDHNGGGDAVSGEAVTFAHLTAFQLGIYEQLKKVLARNPDAKVVLLEYVDVAIPDWSRAYAQVVSLFPQTQRQRLFELAVHDPKGLSDACDVDPKGHPNRAMHEAWASQILTWMMSADVLRELGFAAEARWNDEY